MTVQGEFHILGLRMLEELLKNDGWDAEILPQGNLKATVAELSKRRRVDAICLAATMPSNVERVAETIRLIRATPGLGSMKVIVGGPAFDTKEARSELTDRDGGSLADLVARNMSEAVEFIKAQKS